MATRSTRARHRAKKSSGSPLGTLVVLAVLIGGAIFAWNWYDSNIGGDADSRLHVYNSRYGFIRVEISKPGDDRWKVKTIELEDRRGQTITAHLSGEYVVEAQLPGSTTKKVKAKIPASPGSTDILIDFGESGEFYVVPIFYLPDEWSREQKEKELARLEKKYQEREYGGRNRIKLPVRIDYGFNQGAPVSKGGALKGGGRYGWLAALLGNAIAEENEKEAYYVLADSARYRSMVRKLAD